jgi:hypothetical protein
MEKNFSKSYLRILKIWVISSLAAFLIPFLLIDFTGNIIQIFKFISCLLAGVSSILIFYVVENKLNIITKVMLIIFPIILLLCLFFFSNKTDCLVYNIYFIITFIYFIFGLIIYFIKKDKILLGSSIVPILYSSSLMIIVTIKLDRYITLIDDSIEDTFLTIGFITAILSIIVYLCVVKNKTSKKQYVGNLLLTFFCVLIFAFGIPSTIVKNVNYSFDASIGKIDKYKIIDKDFSSGGKGNLGNYYVVIKYGGSTLKVKLPYDVYEKYDVNDYIRLVKHKGAINIPYFEHII